MRTFATRLARYPIALAVGVAVLAQAPFLLLMPFHIDDGIFLSIADNIRDAPGRPMDRPVIWEGQIWSDMMSYSHPPLAAYVVAAVNRLTGGPSETALHLVYLPVWVLLVVAMWHFLGFLQLPQMAGTLMTVFAPAIFVSSHTLMMDVPTLSFGLAGVVVALYGLRGGKRSWVLAGGGLVAVAVWLTYTAALYLIAPGVYAVARRRPLMDVVALCLPPALALVAWFGWVHQVTGRVPFLDVLDVLAVGADRPNTELLPRALYNLVMTGGALVVAPPLLLLSWRTGRGPVYLIAALLASLAVRLVWPEEGVGHAAAIGVLAVGGLAVLIEAGLAGWAWVRRGDADRRAAGLALLAWVVILFPVTVRLFPCGSARYLIWLAPPLIALLLAAWPPAGRRWAWALWAVAQVGLATSMAWADLDMARAYRRAARALTTDHPTAGGRVWVATDWSLRHYLRAAGGRTILRYDVRPEPGDVVVKSTLTAPTWWTHYEHPPYGEVLEVREVRGRFPLHVLNPLVRAGLYSDYWGFVPIWPARGSPVDTLTVYRVTRPLPPCPGLERLNHGLLRPAGPVDPPA